MADGTWHRAADGAEPRLAQADPARRRIWAVCRCGREGCVDPAPWLGQGLSNHTLVQLEDRVRCACGARRLRLELRAAAEGPTPASGIYVFR